jgi:hypothetical protein
MFPYPLIRNFDLQKMKKGSFYLIDYTEIN